MLPETYQDGAKIHCEQEGTGRIVWKSYRKAENWGDADIQLNQNQDGERYPKSWEVLWRDESTLSAQYRKTGLQLEASQGKERGESWKSLIIEEEGVNTEQPIPKSQEAVWERGP